MKNRNGFRAMGLAAVILGLSFGSNAQAKTGGGVFDDFVGAYSGTITFPTTLFGMAVNYSGPGVLIVNAKGKKATFQFLCSASAPMAIGTSVSIVSKLNANGKFVTNGGISGESFVPVTGKFKLRGKKLSSSYTLSAPATQTSLNWGQTLKLSGKSVTATGPATFTYPFGSSSGSFTFKGKRVSM